jgi:hypothetical protein
MSTSRKPPPRARSDNRDTQRTARPSFHTLPPANITFYEHLGFERIAELVAEPSGIGFWTFRRG